MVSASHKIRNGITASSFCLRPREPKIEPISKRGNRDPLDGSRGLPSHAQPEQAVGRSRPVRRRSVSTLTFCNPLLRPAPQPAVRIGVDLRRTDRRVPRCPPLSRNWRHGLALMPRPWGQHQSACGSLHPEAFSEDVLSEKPGCGICLEDGDADVHSVGRHGPGVDGTTSRTICADISRNRMLSPELWRLAPNALVVTALQLRLARRTVWRARERALVTKGNAGGPGPSDSLGR